MDATDNLKTLSQKLAMLQQTGISLTNFLLVNSALDSFAPYFKTFGDFIWSFIRSFFEQVCVLSDKIALLHNTSYGS